MTELDSARLIAAIGIICQVMIDSLLVGLFVLLRSHADGRGWFHAWTIAWGCVAVALASVTWSYFGPLPSEWQPLATYLLQFVYLAGKVAFVLYLVAGYLLYAGAPRRLVRLRYLLPAAVGYAALAYLFSRGVMPTVIWQAIPNILLFYAGALVATRVPARQRTLGLRLSGAVFGVMGTLWIIYLFGFAPQLRPLVPELSQILLFIARNNPYFDLATHILMAFGMVLILLEDAKREVDAAHIKLNRAHRRLREQSRRDALTGCLNRRAFSEGAGLEHAGAGGIVVVADLDNLKDVNDAYGHRSGDALLQYFAARLREQMGDADRLYRWGGDEFMLLLPRGDIDVLLARLNAHLESVPRCELPDGRQVDLEVSLGAASFDDPDGIERAVHVADRAMYRHKRVRKRRRNRYPA